MSARPSLLVVDIDGTLLNRSGCISAEDKKALARAGEAGIRVSLSTGRAIQACRGILDDLLLDGYHMFFDGAVVADPRASEEVYVEPISPELVRPMVDYIRQQEIVIELYSAAKYFVEWENWATDIRREFFGLEPTIADFGSVCQRERIIKATLPVRSAEEKARVTRFHRHFAGRLNFSWTRTPAYPDVDFVNVVDREVSKGKALEELASFLGIPLARVAAIGNGVNDVSLLSTAGLAIAMDDAPDELKAVADHVTPDVEHSGVAAAVEEFVLW